MVRIVFGTVCLSVALGSPVRAATPEQIKAAAEKSVRLLQHTGPQFFRKSGCVACHHQTAASLAVAEARVRGIPFNEETAREQREITAVTIKSYRSRFLQRADHPANSATGTGFLLLGLAAENFPADENTDANVIEMAGRQAQDGSWTAFGHRPPLEYSRIIATALAVRAMQNYGPPGLKPKFDRRIERAREWLTLAKAETNADHVFRLLGLAWSGAEQKLLAEEVDLLLKKQRPDGGWAQLPALESDAYATGLTLYALHQAGEIAATNPAYQRGVDFLLRTQLEDGSWLVKTRSFPFQPYFESGFPHGADQWLSASATGFSAVALMNALPARR